MCRREPLLAENIGIEGGLGVFCLKPFALGAVSPVLVDGRGGEVLLDNFEAVALPTVGMFRPEVVDLSVDDLAF